MKCNYYTIAIFLIFFNGFGHAQIIVTDDFVPSHMNREEDLKGNLVRYFEVKKCAFIDSISERQYADAIGSVIISRDSTYTNSKWRILSAYSLYDRDSLVFFTMTNPRFIPGSIKIAYIPSRNKYYLLGNISDNDLNSLLNSEWFSIADDSDILRYCRLITILKHPSSYIKFIADIKELLLESLTLRNGFSLSQVSPFTNIKVTLPSIEKSAESVKISYYFVEDEDINKATVILSGSNITTYQEENIGKIPYWHGLYFIRY